MTAFEYYSVMVAVVLGLGVTQILAAIGRYVQSPAIARTYWIHSLWVLILLAAHFAAWSNIWHLRGSLEFSYGAYVYVLLGPMLLFLAARVLVPNLDQGQRIDLEQHYFAVRKSFFAFLLLFVLWPQLLETLLAGRPTTLTGLVVHAAFVVPILLCLLTTNRLAHAGAALLTIAFFVLETFVAAP